MDDGSKLECRLNVHEFQESIDGSVVVFHVMSLKDSLFVWIGNQTPCNMASFAMATQTKYVRMLLLILLRYTKCGLKRLRSKRPHNRVKRSPGQNVGTNVWKIIVYFEICKVKFQSANLDIGAWQP